MSSRTSSSSPTARAQQIADRVERFVREAQGLSANFSRVAALGWSLAQSGS